MVWPIIRRYLAFESLHLTDATFASQRNAAECRRKMRMSGLCKVEMSAFMEGRGPHGNGANRVEPTRTGSIESVAPGTAAAAADAPGSRGAAASKRPPGATDAAR